MARKKNKPRVIGIDLGTTNSLAACFIDGAPKLIPNALGEHLTPSVVSILPDGEAIVGRAAKERLLTHPGETAAVFKRSMGTRRSYDIGGFSLSPQELSALVLKSLKADAEAFLGCDVSKAVISVPAYFNDHQRRATEEAGRLAGLEVQRLISEPTAAAMAYGLHEQSESTDYIVFDLGGGTFDVSVVDWFEGVLEVRAVAGDSFLGGEDFNEAIYRHFVRTFGQHGQEAGKGKGAQADAEAPAAAPSPQERAMLRKRIEQAKLALSTERQAAISSPLYGEERALNLTRERFERISADLLGRMREPLRKALKDAGAKVAQMDKCILVGGATRMPMVRAFVAKTIGKLPTYTINPDEAVALGAGVCAGMVEQDNALREQVMTDVCPFSLGVSISKSDEYGNSVSGFFSPIIERNSTIPISRVERYTNAQDNQEGLFIPICQGESRLARDNVELGVVRIAIPPKPRGEAAADVRFTYDVNGILEVEVTSVDTGKTERLVITNQRTDMSEEEVEARLAQLASIKIHPRDQARNRYLADWGERLYQESLGPARDMISDGMARFTQALDRQDPKEVEEAADELEKLLRKIDASPF